MKQRSMTDAIITFIFDDGHTSRIKPDIVTRAEYDADRVLADNNSAFFIRELDGTLTSPLLDGKTRGVHQMGREVAREVVRVLLDDLEIWAKPE